MYGQEIAPPEETLDGTRVFMRFVDGLAFRYYWSTEGLRPEDFAFRPGPDSMSLHELIDHILQLVFMIKQAVFDAEVRERFESDDPKAKRDHALENLEQVRDYLRSLDDETLLGHRVLKRSGRFFPIWNILNGPLADALTHVGQINAWRRLNGNPTPRADVFEGRPPR